MLDTFKTAGLVVYLLGIQRGGGVRAQWRLAGGLLGALRVGRYDAIWLQYMTPTLLPLLVARFFTQKLIAAVPFAAAHYSPSGLARMRWLACH